MTKLSLETDKDGSVGRFRIVNLGGVTVVVEVSGTD